MFSKRMIGTRVFVEENAIFIEQGETSLEEQDCILIYPELIDILIDWLKEAKEEALKFKEQE